LKDKTKEQLKQFEHVLTDTQKKWLSQLEQTGWDWETFEKNITVKQFEKNKKMYSMKNYIENNGCRRTFILDYFNNSQLVEKNEFCCDFCYREPLEIPDLIEEVSEEVSGNLNFDAKELLKKLFLNKF
ncbi:RecQ family zinc-binding domain-containing protein, partial [Vagococcus fluvialis]